MTIKEKLHQLTRRAVVKGTAALGFMGAVASTVGLGALTASCGDDGYGYGDDGYGYGFFSLVSRRKTNKSA